MKIQDVVGYLLYNMDIFGQTVQLSTAGNKKFSTFIGQSCTLFIMAPCIILLIYNVQEILEQRSPNVYQLERETDPPFIELNRKNFTFVTVLTDLNFQGIKKYKNYYDYKLEQCVRTRKRINESYVEVTANCSKIPLSTCNLNKSFSTDQQINYFKNYKLENMFCIEADWWDNNKIVTKFIYNTHFIEQFIQGYGSSDKFAYLQLKASLCKNSTEFQKCAPQVEIDQMMKKGYFISYLQNTYIDNTKKGNPYGSTIKLLQTPFSKGMTKQIMNYYIQATSICDVGLLTQDQQIHQTLIAGREVESTDPEENEFFVTQIIQQDNFQQSQFRNYPKLQNVIGNLGGLWTLFSSVILIIIQPLINSMMKINTAIQLQFNERKYLGTVLSKNKQKSNDKSSVLNGQQLEQKVKNYIQYQKLDFFYSKFQELKFAIINMFGQNFILKKEIKLIEKSLDFVTIAQKLKDIDKIKTIIMDPNQLQLFDAITENEDKIIKQQQSERILNLYQCFENITSKEQMNIIDQNLIARLNSGLLDLFQDLKYGRKYYLANYFQMIQCLQFQIEEIDKTVIQVDKTVIQVHQNQVNLMNYLNQFLIR